MERIIIIGCTGSGKSTLAKELNKITKLALYHLDLLYFKEDMTRISLEEFIKKQEEIVAKDKWIIDGDYVNTLEIRLSRCDTVIFLDYDSKTCLEGVKKRTGKLRSDLPFIEKEEVHDVRFYDHINNYHETDRVKIISLLAKYPNKKLYHFSKQAEANEFINSLKGL